jgi:hypothetical protein
MIAVIALLLAAAPAWADQPSSSPSSTTGLGALRSSDPYKKLFELQTDSKFELQNDWKKMLGQTREGTIAKPKLVCGMTIIPADPKIDPKMVIALPSGGVDYKIRAVDPPICNPAR